MAFVASIVLIIVAAYTGWGWLQCFREAVDLHRNGAYNVEAERRINETAIPFGFAFIFAVGFLGMIAS